MVKDKEFWNEWFNRLAEDNAIKETKGNPIKCLTPLQGKVLSTIILSKAKPS